MAPGTSFAIALRLAKELAFGVLAVGGCLLVQCLLLTWLVLHRVQISFLLLQARMLNHIYGRKAGRVVARRSVGTQTAGKYDCHTHSFPTADKSLGPSTSKPPSTKPQTTHPPAEKINASKAAAPNVAPHMRPTELPAANGTTSATASAVGTEWETKTLVERRPNGKRPYAIKQVDKPATKESESPPAPKLSPKSASFKSLMDGRQSSFVPPQAGMRRSTAVSAIAHTDMFEDMWSKGNTISLFSSLWAEEAASRKGHEKGGSPAVQREMTHTSPSSSDSDSDTLLGKAAFHRKGSGNGWPLSTSTQQEPPRTKFKFAKTSGVRLIKDDGPQGQEASSGVSNNVVPDQAEDKQYLPIPSEDHLTPVKRYGPGQMLKLRGSPMAKAPRDLPYKEHWMAIAKQPLQTVDPFSGGLEVSVMVPNTDNEILGRGREATPRPSPEQIAREAVADAYREREAYRLKLNNGYSITNAYDFKEKAKAYKHRRYDLIALMPSGVLNEEDEARFPYLSSMDTGPPPVDSGDEESSPLVSSTGLAKPSQGSESGNSPFASREDTTPLVVKAQKSYQTMLLATKNLSEACQSCNSKFCLNGYSIKAKPKMKAARDLYEKTRQRLADAHGDGVLTEELAHRLPEEHWC
ncbi:hypothetical protein Q7P37_009328 [Cladosporium fusiforme]